MKQLGLGYGLVKQGSKLNPSPLIENSILTEDELNYILTEDENFYLIPE